LIALLPSVEGLENSEIIAVTVFAETHLPRLRHGAKETVLQRKTTTPGRVSISKPLKRPKYARDGGDASPLGDASVILARAILENRLLD
jgi:hypothetical protein